MQFNFCNAHTFSVSSSSSIYLLNRKGALLKIKHLFTSTPYLWYRVDYVFSSESVLYKKRTFGWLLLAILRIKNVSYTWIVNRNNIHIPTCTHTASCSLLVHILLGANMFGTRCTVSDRSMEPDSMRFMSTYGYLYINYANRNRRLF